MIHLVYVVYGIDPIGPGPAPFHLRTNDVRNQALPTLFLWLIDPSIWGRQEEKWAKRYRQFWFREIFVVATCSRSIKVNGQATLLIDTAEPR